MRVSPFQKFIHVVLSLLCLNALIGMVALSLVTFKPQLVSETGQRLASSIHERAKSRADHILDVASQGDIETARLLALEFIQDKEEIGFGDHSWASKREIWIFLTKYYEKKKDFKKAAKILDRWASIHAKDVTLMDLQVRVYSQLKDREKDHFRILKTRADQLQTNELASKAYVRKLRERGEEKAAAEVILSHMTQKDTLPQDPWKIFYRGIEGNFSRVNSIFTKLNAGQDGEFFSTFSLAPDTKYVRFDPTDAFDRLSEVKIEIVHKGNVVETLQLTPELKPFLHDMMYDGQDGTYVVTSRSDPYFVIELKSEALENTTLNLNVQKKRKHSAWIYDELVGISAENLLRASENYPWEFAPEQVLDIRSLFEGDFDAIDFSTRELVLNQATINKLVDAKRFELAVSSLIDYLVMEENSPDLVWRTYVRADSSYVEKRSRRAYFSETSAGKFVSVSKLDSDVTHVRGDPGGTFYKLNKVMIEVVKNGSVTESIILNPESTEVLNQMRFVAADKSHIIVDSEDPYFSMSLGKPVPDGAELRITVENTSRSRLWSQSVLSKIPAEFISKGVSNYNWSLTDRASSNVRDFIIKETEFVR